MDYKTLLVHLDRGARSATRLEIGFSLAEAFDAHLIGLFALSAPRIPSYAIAEAESVVREAESRYRAEALRKAESAFRAAAARHGRAKSEWRVSERDALEAVCLSARYADLVIVGQREPGDEGWDTGVAPDFTDELVLSIARPVLLVPYAGSFGRVGRRVLVAWSSTREAARALADALPLLQRAESVEVVAFQPHRNAHGEQPGADIGLYLARHGVKVTVSRQDGGDIDVGAQLLSRAADLDVDLIVMGAYGHSRVRELVLGGVTRTLLESMTVPTLMAR